MTAVALISSTPDARLFGVRIYSANENVSVTLVPSGSQRSSGCAEACVFLSEEFGEGSWYTNRVLVQDPEKRGVGMGSYLLSLLKETLRPRSDFRRLLCEPGGYSSKISEQRRFYRKNGFVKRRNCTNLYVWEPKIL
jgi:GNAT superfamily N-acetyltransferase